MNPVSRTLRRRVPQETLHRASSLLSHPHSRPVPPYRRSLSTHPLLTLPQYRTRIANPFLTSAAPFLLLRATAIPQLRSRIRLDQIQPSPPSPLRRFHASIRGHADAKPRDSQGRAASPSESSSGEAPKDGGAGNDASQQNVKEGDARASRDESKAPSGEGGEENTKERSRDGDGRGKEKEDDEGGQKKSKEEEEPPPPPPHGDKTPWQVFMETMTSEFEKSKEWNDHTKAIASSAHQFTESESVRRAREAYDKTSGAASSAVRTTAGAIGKGAVWTWDTPVIRGVRKAANATGEVVDKATRPIRETEAFKNVKNVIDDGSSSRYGGWVEKEERRKRREAELQGLTGGEPEVMKEDPNAGTNVTLHKDAKWKEAWREFRDTNTFVQGVFSMGQAYQESENPLVSTARSITDRIAGFFAENETAQVIRKIRTMDPAFQLEPFLRDLREYILPEVLDAYVKGDVETLKTWLSAAQYSVYEALTKQYATAGLQSDGRILDIRHVDILKARILDPGDVPVFVITCRTQEVHVYRNSKTGELAAGMEDKIQLVTYAIGITRMPEDVNNPETRGWRLIEMQKSGREWY